MRNTPTKADNVGDTLPANNFNAMNNELENAITTAGGTLDPNAGPDTNLFMLGEAMAQYASGSTVYQDSGSANSYVLGLSTTLKPITAYLDNTTAIFKAGNTNTGSATINVNSVGSKNITLPDGSPLPPGAIIADSWIQCVYKSSTDRFELLGYGPLWLNAREFGATGDGSTDDITSIQNAVDFLASAGGGTLIFHAGTYVISAAIDLDNAINVTLRGSVNLVWSSAPHGSIIKATTPGMNMLDFSPGGGRVNAKISLIDLFLDGDDKAQDLVRFDNFSTANFTRVICLDATRYGMNLGDTNSSFGAEIDTCYFNGNDTAGLRNNSRNTFLRFSRVDAGDYAVDIAADGGQSEIIGCHLESGSNSVLRITTAANNRIVGNIIASPSVINTAVEITGVGATNNMIVGNAIQGEGSAGSIGISCAVTNNIISGNTIGTVEDGIVLNTNSTSVTGNTINATQYAVSESTPGGANTITGNNVESGTANIANDETILMNNKGLADQEPVNTDTLSAGNNNDYVISSVNVKTLFINADAAGSSLTGIAGGVRGKRLRITHLSANTFDIEHQDANSSAANRIVTSTGATVTIAQNVTVELEYNASASRWFLIN